jgi:hypothetical protein
MGRRKGMGKAKGKRMRRGAERAFINFLRRGANSSGGTGTEPKT